MWLQKERGEEIHMVKYIYVKYICDMIKGNELDVGNIGFELQAKTGEKHLCFILFFTSKNWSYICNHISD